MTGHDGKSRSTTARIDDTVHPVFALFGLSLIAILISLATSGALLGLISP